MSEQKGALQAEVNSLQEALAGERERVQGHESLSIQGYTLGYTREYMSIHEYSQVYTCIN